MMLIVLLFLICVVLVGSALAYHKLSVALADIRLGMAPKLDNVFQQIEALMALYTELDIRRALPPTRGFAGSPDFLRLLMTYMLTNRPQTVVECSSGISTLVLARCVEKNKGGHVYSLENDPLYAEKTRAMIRRYGLESFVTVVDAPLTNLTLPAWNGQWYSTERLDEIGDIDLLVIDGPPQFISDKARYPALPILYEKLAPNAVVFLDDADRPDERSAVDQWLTEFPRLKIFDTGIGKCEKGCAALIKSADRNQP